VNHRKIFFNVFKEQSFNLRGQQGKYLVQRAESFAVDDNFLREKIFKVVVQSEFIEALYCLINAHGADGGLSSPSIALGAVSVHIFHSK